MASLVHTFPNVLTHRYHPLRGAFQNICHLPSADAERIIGEIRDETGSYRKPNYLARRMQVETWLIAERMRKLGRTPLSRPIYSFLGKIADEPDQARPASIVIPLAEFHPDVLTFTFPDSMSVYPDKNAIDSTSGRHHGQAYTLPDIERIVHRFGFPDPGLPKIVRGPNSFIEVQIWGNGPLGRYH